MQRRGYRLGPCPYSKHKPYGAHGTVLGPCDTKFQVSRSRDMHRRRSAQRRPGKALLVSTDPGIDASNSTSPLPSRQTSRGGGVTSRGIQIDRNLPPPPSDPGWGRLDQAEKEG